LNSQIAEPAKNVLNIIGPELTDLRKEKPGDDLTNSMEGQEIPDYDETLVKNETADYDLLPNTLELDSMKEETSSAKEDAEYQISSQVIQPPNDEISFTKENTTKKIKCGDGIIKKSKGKECPVCHKLLRDNYKLKYHLNTHTNERPFSCEVCQSRFKCTRDLNKHSKHHKEKNIDCHHCTKKFPDKESLYNHVKHASEQFLCNTCGRKFKSKAYLQSHERNKHTGETPFLCALCDVRFTMSWKLKRHNDKEHPTSTEEPYVCGFCGKEYRKKQVFKEHEKTHSDALTGKFSNECHICQKTFKTRDALRHHQFLHDKKFECEQCGKCFGYSRNLELHLKSHKGIKDFQCHNCTKAFYSLRSLKMHMEIKHMTVFDKKASFVCDKCDKKYTNQPSLDRHNMKEHSDSGTS